MRIYLDNAATTKPFSRVVSAVADCMRDCYYNPAALYSPAMEAEREIKRARTVIAESIGASEKEILFTSGGTESNNLAVTGHMSGQRKEGVILYSRLDHPSTQNACMEAAALHGHIAREIPILRSGELDLHALENMLDSRVRLICVTQVCSETGSIAPLSEIVHLRDHRAADAAVHVDGVQGYLRTPFSMTECNVQSFAMSAHKIHGPKGVGALAVRKGHRIRPILVGGGQQGNLRSGTENSPGVVGFRTAVECYAQEVAARPRMVSFRQTMLETLRQGLPDLVVMGQSQGAAGNAEHILCMAFPPVRGETLVHALEDKEVFIGTGSACSSRKGKRSALFTAMGISPEVIDSSVRVSFSVMNTQEEVLTAAREIVEKVSRLRRYQRR
ncbi:MAG: cysteine desulfurase [Clostridia bacterium]|nr:cysteine desulfurase [Clostridia bacterium]